ncbi:MAG: hypothetical protein FJ146_13045 [Deltaproteobacteria bacterium]|nr:hypothetical protein [Deltaproteobacteria bacterium]
MEQNVTELVTGVSGRSFVNVGLRDGPWSKRQLKIAGTNVYFADQVLDLSDFHLTLRLFRLYAIAKGGRCSLREILAFVYRMQPTQTNSARFHKSARVRAVKLLSRARLLAMKYFDDELDWFCYDYKTRTWALYRGCDAASVRQLHS